MKKIKFEKEFLFGASSSGPQTEGNYNIKNKTNWDVWFDKEPNNFYESISPETLLDETINYKQDVNIMSDLNLNIFRTSIQWSRIINDFKTNSINEEGVLFYKNYFSEIKKKGIKLMVTLHHFDMPYEMQKIGGWENQEVINKFVEYSKICFREFGEYVDYWSTFNEPLVIVDSGYMLKYHLPLKEDMNLAFIVAKNIMIANAKAVIASKEFNINKIGIFLNLTPAYPLNKNDKNDVRAVKNEHLVTNDIFLHPAIKGKVNPELLELLKESNIDIKLTNEEKEIISKGKVNYLGVNYYAPVRLTGNDKLDTSINNRSRWFNQVKHEKAIFNEHRGWEIYGKGIYDIAKWIKDDYGNIEWLVTENGLGIPNEDKFIKNNEVQDDYRINFYKEHLYWLSKAIEEGTNCKGYMVWTFIDNWSWLNTFKNRYGLVHLDLKTSNRLIKKSGHWFKKVAHSKELYISNENEILDHVKEMEK